ncbi:hypothetical protein [Lysinibacillus sp. NPDC093692]
MENKLMKEIVMVWQGVNDWGKYKINLRIPSENVKRFTDELYGKIQ